VTRLIGPDEGCRTVFYTSGPNAGTAAAQGEAAIIYTDEALSVLADIITTTGDAIAGSQVMVDAYSRIPLFQYPDGLVDTVWTSIAGGPAVRLDARLDDRLDTLTARVTALEPGGDSAALARSANLSDLADAGTARTNLGLGDSATLDVGTGSGDVAAGDAPAAALAAAAELVDDLSGVTNAATARTNLGLASAATLTPTAIAADPAFVTGYSRPRGNRLVTWGDSTILGGSVQSSFLHGNCGATFAALLSGQRLNLIANAGATGDTAAMALARFAADVAPWSPHIVDIGVGTNDISLGVTFATYKTNIVDMVAAVRSIGATPALRTIVPSNTLSHATINGWNAWLRRYASQQRIPLLDAYAALVDTTNGHYQASLTDDGIHPNTAGRLALGAMYHATLTAWANPCTPYMSADNVDAFAMWTTNNLLLTDTNADGVPDGWAAYNGSSGFAHALVVDADVPGQMMQTTMTAAASARVLERAVTGGITEGDVLAFSGVFTCDGGVTCDCKLTFTGAAGAARTYISPAAAVTRGAWYHERPVPAGATGIVVGCLAGPGTGVCAWGRVTVLNLTTGAIF
jgi:lysophospholipase L1-like esterase